MAIDAQGFWQPDLYPKQREAYDACQPGVFRNIVLLSGPRKSTKCVAPDTLIFLAEGMSRIGNLAECKDGDYVPIDQKVCAFDCASSKLVVAGAKEFFNSGVKPAKKLSTKMGYSLTCSPNHPIWSECDGKIDYRTADEIQSLAQSGKSVWFPFVREHPVAWPTKPITIDIEWYQNQEFVSFTASERIAQAVANGCDTITKIMRATGAAYDTVKKWWHHPAQARRLSVTIDAELAYILGLLVGDGCYTPKVLANKSIRYSSDDYELVSAIRAANKYFPDLTVKHEAVVDYAIKSATLRAFLAQSGMGGKYSYEKDIPDFIIQSPKTVVVAFLQGLFDTDGTVCRCGSSSFSTTSEKLSAQVQTLLLALGIRSSRGFKANDYRGSWKVTPRREDGFEIKVGFRLLRKQSRICKKVIYTRDTNSYPPSVVNVLKNLHKTRALRGVGELPRHVHKHVIDAVFRGNVSLSKKRIAPVLKILNCEQDESLDPYLADWTVWWDKLEKVEETISPLVDLSVEGTHNFVGNGFINHNTWACYHIAAQHAWNVPNANVCLITITQAAGVDSGPWQHLTERWLPQWIDADFGMEWVRKPYLEGASKKHKCKVRDKFGGISTFSLESLKDEQEVEERFKGKEYSMFWVNELTKFNKYKTFTTLRPCLRGYPESQLLFLADTNPCLTLGSEHFAYKLWYQTRNADLEELAELYPDVKDPSILIPLRDRLNLIEFTVDDNLSMTKEDKDSLLADFIHDPDLVAAYYYGKWVTASADAVFYKTFRPSFHCIPNIPNSPVDPEPELLVPQPNCGALIASFDPGDSVNSAGVIMEKTFRPDHLKMPNGSLMEVQVPVLKYLDELVILAEPHSMEEYVLAFMEKMQFWEELISDMAGRPVPVRWTFWSDSNVFTKISADSGRYLNQVIYDASVTALSQGLVKVSAPIMVNGAENGPGALIRRVDLFKRLLFQERVYFSREKCPILIESIKSIKRGRTQTAVVDRGSKWKHAFDAASYGAASELHDEIARACIGHLSTRRVGETSLMTVPY